MKPNTYIGWRRAEEINKGKSDDKHRLQKKPKNLQRKQQEGLLNFPLSQSNQRKILSMNIEQILRPHQKKKLIMIKGENTIRHGKQAGGNHTKIKYKDIKYN